MVVVGGCVVVVVDVVPGSSVVTGEASVVDVVVVDGSASDVHADAMTAKARNNGTTRRIGARIRPDGMLSEKSLDFKLG